VVPGASRASGQRARVVPEGPIIGLRRTAACFKSEVLWAEVKAEVTIVDDDNKTVIMIMKNCFLSKIAFGEGSRKPEVGDPGFDDDAVCADDDYDADYDDADKSGGAGDADDDESSSMRVKC